MLKTFSKIPSIPSAVLHDKEFIVAADRFAQYYDPSLDQYLTKIKISNNYSKYGCINCGAPKNKIVCEYCKT